MIATTLVYKGPLGAKVKGFNKEVKKVLQDAIKKWHDEYVQFHFGEYESVNARYPGVYKWRQRRYSKIKQRRFGHQNMLQYTGITKALITSTINVSGTSKGARGRMPGAQYLNFHRGQKSKHGIGKHPDARSELLALNQAEADALAEYVQNRITEYMNSQEETEEVKV